MNACKSHYLNGLSYSSCLAEVDCRKYWANSFLIFSIAIEVGNLPIWAVISSIFSASSVAEPDEPTLVPATLTRRIVSSVAVLTIDQAVREIYICCEMLCSYSLLTVEINSAWKALAGLLLFNTLRTRF